MSITTIMVVEDNPTNMKLTADLLEFEGIKVVRARDAAEAKQALELLVPDLILMDLQMPGQDGLSLTRELKSDPVLQHVRIVALTASAMRGDSQRALDAGCDGYISKPVDTRTFIDQVRSYLDVEAGSLRSSNQTTNESEAGHEDTDCR